LRPFACRSESVCTRPVFALLVALLFLSVLSGPAAAAPEGTLTWGLHVTLAARWLDPSDTEAFINPFMVLYAIHDALVKPMPAGDNTPSLAESWTVSKDGLTYEFVLRKNAKFHNGDPVTAEDVKFSFDRYKGAAAKLLKDKVREVQIVDAGHVRFHLKEPWPDFMTFYGTSATGAAWIVPKKYVEKAGEDGFKKAPVGAGPYKFVSFNPGIELVMEAFEGYWRKAPSVKRLVFRSMPDETTRAAALKAGEVDIVYLLSGPTAEDVKKTPGLRLAAAKPPGVVFLDTPEQWDPKSAWADRRVRLAASYALDRNALNQAETLGLSRPTGALIPRVLDFARPYDPPAYDPAQAKKLLAEAGYPSGFDAGDLTPFPPYFSLAEAIGGYLQAVGIRTRVRTMERAAFLTAWREKKIKGVIMGLGAPAGNAATRIEVYVTKNGIYSSGVVPEIEDLYQRQARELDRKKREALLYQIQQIMHDRVMFVPIYELAFLWGVGPRVEEACVDHIKGFSYSAPYEDLKLKAAR
jgi:peptide/nickel transport system substrate-binding protein